MSFGSKKDKLLEEGVEGAGGSTLPICCKKKTATTTP